MQTEHNGITQVHGFQYVIIMFEENRNHCFNENCINKIKKTNMNL